MTPEKLLDIRPDLELIADIVPANSTVLDLGCGTGELLYKLLHEKNVQAHGVEIFERYIYSCIEKGVPVIHADLDEGLDDYPDKSFDYVILSKTIQVVKKPNLILNEMLRVGKTCIISLPNFGYWIVRAQLFFKGIMPVSKILPYEWYDTPNIHLVSLKDFNRFCREQKISIINQVHLKNNCTEKFLPNLIPNLFSELSIYVLRRDNMV